MAGSLAERLRVCNVRIAEPGSAGIEAGLQAGGERFQIDHFGCGALGTGDSVARCRRAGARIGSERRKIHGYIARFGEPLYNNLVCDISSAFNPRDQTLVF